jgi:hypothetical protein
VVVAPPAAAEVVVVVAVAVVAVVVVEAEEEDVDERANSPGARYHSRRPRVAVAVTGGRSDTSGHDHGEGDY